MYWKSKLQVCDKKKLSNHMFLFNITNINKHDISKLHRSILIYILYESHEKKLYIFQQYVFSSNN